MFDRIAPKYDLLNHILSAGIDRHWRKKLINRLAKSHPQSILDIATGTGDIAIAAADLHPKKITAIDISEKMLAVAAGKVKEKKLESIIELKRANSESLSYDDNSFDAITVAFGVRNFEHLQEGFKEMHRVLKPNGICLILEFSQPVHFPVKQLYRFYSAYILPRIGGVISKEKSAYQYLPESVKAFPQGNSFLELFSSAGFKNTTWQPLTFGIASLYEGHKT